MTAKYDIVLVANSPGELSAFVKPVARAISDKLKDIRIILVLTPCQYNSGKELEYIKTVKGLSKALSAEEYKKWVFRNQKPDIEFKEKGLVLYLGGDLAHAMLVARKVRYPAFAYVQEKITWKRFYKRFLVPDAETHSKLTKNGDLKGKFKIIGNLMVDSVAHLPKWLPEKNVVTLFPGSRDWQIKYMTSFYEKIINYMKTEIPEITFQIVSSPFVGALPIDGAKLVNFEDISNSELAITIPGTNTAKLAALGIPMILILPLDKPDAIPLEGLAHFISKIPYLGSKFKRKIADRVSKDKKLLALPNIKANKEIVPEIKGIIDPSAVAMKALSLLKDRKKRQEMSEDLIKAMGEPGASNKIVEEINETLQKTA
jgi:lipid-A-disaccharide synthase